MINISAQPAWLDQLSEDARRRLSRNNEMLEKGSSDVLISPAMKNLEDSVIENFVRETYDSGLYTPYLIDIEESNLSKLGPRSIAKPWDERRADLESYFTAVPLLSFEEFQSFKSDARQTFSIAGRLRPVSQENAVANLESASAGGLPFMQKKGILREQGLATERYVDVFPCVVYTRTQEGGKTRNVMGVGISDVIREMRYHQAFLPIEKSLSWRQALVSPDATDLAISRMMNGKRPDEQIECLDFSAYDASITPDLSGRAFAFISAHFADSYSEEIYRVYVRFATISFYTPDGEYSGNHGVPSGSAFTNTIDSIVQYLILDKSILSGPDSVQIQGDDGIFLIQSGTSGALIRDFTNSGLVVNVDKSESFDNREGTYLQRYYHQNYPGTACAFGGVYSIARALMRLKYLEKFVGELGTEEEMTGDDYFVLRAISILENCKYHPHFFDLIDFVRSNDKHSLAYTQNGLKVFENRSDRRSRAANTNQYGDQSGIESFAVMNYIRTRQG
jgi:hypothetical protein